MRRTKWDYLLDRLIRRLGPAEGKRRFLEIWEQAGKRLIDDYDTTESLREALKVLDGIRH